MVYENKLYKHRKCFRIWHSRLPESVTCCATTTRQIRFGQKRTSDVRDAEETFVHNELQSSGWRTWWTNQSNILFDCDVADSSLPPASQQTYASLPCIYQKFLSYIHTATVTAIDKFENKLINATYVTAWHQHSYIRLLHNTESGGKRTSTMQQWGGNSKSSRTSRNTKTPSCCCCCYPTRPHGECSRGQDRERKGCRDMFDDERRSRIWEEDRSACSRERESPHATKTSRHTPRGLRKRKHTHTVPDMCRLNLPCPLRYV